MILVIDNYDSFVYNLVQYIGEYEPDLKVFRNDKITLSEIKKMSPELILVSPGPGRPENAGISVDLIKTFYKNVPILGVCLGHQAIGYAFGGAVLQARRIMHGKTSLIHHTGEGIFNGIPSPFEATRYHSLLVDKKNFPVELSITAWTDKGEVMGLSHKEYPLWGVQFHPESILTRHGKEMIRNFLALRKRRRGRG